MEGEIDSFDFVLAEMLGVPLGAVRAMPNTEVIEWRAFLVYRDAMRQLHGAGPR